MHTVLHMGGSHDSDTMRVDTINYSIIFMKMEIHSFHINNKDWFRSYLLNRQQLVSCHNVLSYKCQLDIGVPKEQY